MCKEKYEELLKEGLPIILNFSSTSCVPCRMIKPVLEKIAKQYEGKVNVLNLNVNDCMEFAQEMMVMSIPTQFFIEPDGTPIAYHVGFMDEQNFYSAIKDYFKIEVPAEK